MKVGQFKDVAEIYSQPTLVAMATKIGEFWRKIINNSAWIRYRS